ncbi:MAG TPA: bifunctional DNA-binding transcriptional regulator/O6-methylguanine-DNA methyltransferase Ada [Pyrinomonadaceae bacterium]|nr:bifunctional DNA-binding transcriptional regulator/O6-methylguanine-DNA methyltransferase Ada [Pyrinomonadaceae bacterium]
MSLAMQRELYSDELTTEQLWEAVLNRDSKSDGTFVYAVTSTHIYCRPSCASRRPRRDRVSFFNSPDAAEQQGFRACKRCHPRDTVDQRSELIQRACDLLESADEPMTLSRLSEELGISAFHLQRTFKKALGISPRQYAASQRAIKFKDGVRGGQPITSAMYDAGYGSSSRLYERSTAELGMTPATYSRNGRGAKIDFAITECELGWLMVAATEKGVCAVRLGSNPNKLEQDLRDEFSAAQINRDAGHLTKSVEAILEHLKGSRPNLQLPLDVQATAFQRLVWEALRAIPYGSTRSYSQVAQSIGRPSAVRAVARACATNPVALVVPCHRVIGSDKSLSGYRWGLDRKKKLLETERRALETQGKK